MDETYFVFFCGVLCAKVVGATSSEGFLVCTPRVAMF